eukprot:scaffold3410_cov158-Amphora_coffeaeformis.AAC.8
MLLIFLLLSTILCLAGFSHGFAPERKRCSVLSLSFTSQQAGQITPFSEAHCNSFEQDKEGDRGAKIHSKRERPRLPILRYEPNWVCINKPAGMTVHRSHRQSKFELVVSTTLKRQLHRKVWPVHRLDHRTSGALLFAFDADTCGKLHTALRSSTNNEKVYVALVRGNWNHLFDSPTATIDKPISVDGTMKEATTIFRCLAVLDDTDNNGATLPCSLVQAELKTGRTHQIRRHAYHMGMPVLGDTQHGDSRVNRWWRNHMGLNRLALHCLSLDLPSWDDGDKRIQLVAPLTEDFRTVLERKELAELWRVACANEPRLKMPFIDIRTGTLGIKKEWQQ